MKKRKKSLVGWIHKNWDLDFDEGYLRNVSITKFPICIPEFNEQVKCRITIEEI